MREYQASSHVWGIRRGLGWYQCMSVADRFESLAEFAMAEQNP
jgi:hypothetical protein